MICKCVSLIDLIRSLKRARPSALRTELALSVNLKDLVLRVDARALALLVKLSCCYSSGILISSLYLRSRCAAVITFDAYMFSPRVSQKKPS